MRERERAYQFVKGWEAWGEEREREREKVIGYLDFFTQKNNEKNWVLKTI